MTPREKQMLDELFQKLRQMERDAPPRTAEAENQIQAKLRQQPSAPYYMAQLLLLQKESLENAKNQIAALKGQRPNHSTENYSREQRDGGGQSFLAGAAQVALGVGGGLLLADFVGDLLGFGFADNVADNLGDVADASDFDIGSEIADFGGDDWGIF